MNSSKISVPQHSRGWLHTPNLSSPGCQGFLFIVVTKEQSWSSPLLIQWEQGVWATSTTTQNQGELSSSAHALLARASNLPTAGFPEWCRIQPFPGRGREPRTRRQLYLEPISVPAACCNKVPHNLVCKAAHIHFLTFMESLKNQKSVSGVQVQSRSKDMIPL